MKTRIISTCLVSLLALSCTKSEVAENKNSVANNQSVVSASRALNSMKPSNSSQSLSENEHISDRVFFEFNDANIKGSYLNDLTAQAKYIKDVLASNPEKNLIVEGNCDEKGGVEYNIALGYKRANAAKEILVKEGIPADKIKVVSFGKERKLVEGTTAIAYLQNRAAITKIDDNQSNSKFDIKGKIEEKKADIKGKVEDKKSDAKSDMKADIKGKVEEKKSDAKSDMNAKIEEKKIK